jgi:hypothetical protein
MTFPFRLGRIAHDPVRVRQSTGRVPMFASIAPGPARVDRSIIAFKSTLWKNDVLPDCTAEALYNIAIACAAIAGFPLYVDPIEPPAFYSHCVGDPPDLAATNGAVMLDVLAKAEQIGLDTGHDRLFPVWSALPKSRSSICAAMVQAPVYTGITLYQQDLASFTAGTPWTGATTTPAEGGHAVFAYDYTPSTIRIGTWGQFVTLDWVRFMDIVEEVHGVSFPQIARRTP